MSDYLQPHEPKLARPPCPSPTPGVRRNPCPMSQWWHPTILSSAVPFSSSLQLSINVDHISKWSSELNLPIPVHFSSLIPMMLIFTLATSCLIISNLPWFMGQTFQVPMQYCSLQHQTLLSLPDTSTVQLTSVTQLCPTLCNPIDCSMPGLAVHHQLPEFTQTHVH